MASLTNRRPSQPSYPTRLSPLPEQQTYSPSSSPSPGLRKGSTCPSARASCGVVSERSDSGISECSLSVDELLLNTTNKLNEAAATAFQTNGTLTSAGALSPTKHPKGVDWQTSVDSAVGEEIDLPKGGSQRKMSREGFLGSSPVNSHSRI